MSKDLVSIIMLSRNSSRYVEDSVKSILAQTYTNWELIFVDDNSNDDTISKMMELKAKAPQKIIISKSVYTKGESMTRNSALAGARGRWIAFLNADDVWAPEKLERQIAFMEEHDYAFTYTCYGLMNMHSKNRNVVVSGKEHITHHDMLRCCWPAYLTVMYDAKKVGTVQACITRENNDYALWLKISDKFDCHLLAEDMATMRTPLGLFGRLLKTDKVKWRYEVFRVEEDLKPVTSFLYTIRNGWYGIMKWIKYVKRVK